MVGMIVRESTTSNERYSIYKVHPPPQRGELDYISTRKAICQEVFSSFCKFLFVLHPCESVPKALHILTDHKQNVNLLNYPNSPVL